MPNITISELHPTGFDLFSDSESYLKELSESELGTKGGAMSTTICAISFAIGFAIGYNL